MAKKGQVQVFEQVMLFFIGLLIFIVCFITFSSYQSYFVLAGNTDQIIQVRDHIAYSIVKATEGLNSTESYTTIEIPKAIGGEPYTINITTLGLNITTLPSMMYSFTWLYGINRTIQIQNSQVSSQSGVIVLYKNGDKIILT